MIKGYFSERLLAFAILLVIEVLLVEFISIDLRMKTLRVGTWTTFLMFGEICLTVISSFILILIFLGDDDSFS